MDILFDLRSQKYSFPIFQHIPQLLHHCHFHLQIKIFLECYLANLPKDTPHVKKCALSFKLSIVLVGNLSHGLSNKSIECKECCNVYRMSYMIVVHITMKRQTTTKNGRASLNADDLIKKKNLINELTSSRILKRVTNMHTRTYTLFIKLNPTPITIYVAPNQCDYWETLNIRYPLW